MAEKRKESTITRSRQVHITPLSKVLEDAINEYNKYRSPEAIAKLVEIKDSIITVEFTGSFCLTCGLIDWIEDLAYILEDKGLNVKLVDIKAPEDLSEQKRVGIFKLIQRKD